MSALYEETAVLIFGGTPVTGRKNIRHAYESVLARHPRMTLETQSIVESPEGLALLHGNWTVESDDGVTRGISTEVIREQTDGTWLFVIDDPYSAGTPPVANR